MPASWIALHDHYEGDGFCNRNVDDAYSLLDKLSCTGERKGFTFEKIVEKHMECFLELARFNEPILESKKVRDFLNRIMAPELQASVQQVKATVALMTDFKQATNFISLSVNSIKQQNRNIGSLTSKGNRKNNRARGQGHHPRGGQGQFQRRSNTGRGRGRGRTHQQQTDRGRGGARGNLSLGYYTPEEWQELSPDQR